MSICRKNMSLMNRNRELTENMMSNDVRIIIDLKSRMILHRILLDIMSMLDTVRKQYA